MARAGPSFGLLFSIAGASVDAHFRRCHGAEASGKHIWQWIKTGEDRSTTSTGERTGVRRPHLREDQLACVEEEKRSFHFRWETYTSHEERAKPSREELQAATAEALREDRGI